MKAEQFCFWLQGHIEMNPLQKDMNSLQYETLKKHLESVVTNRITPTNIVANVILKDLESNGPIRRSLRNCT